MFDDQQQELTRDMTALADMEQRLFHQLKGEIDLAQPGNPDAAPLLRETEYMVEARLQAWVRLFLTDPQGDRNFLFVTDSPGTWEILLDHASESRCVFQGVLPTDPGGEAARRLAAELAALARESGASGPRCPPQGADNGGAAMTVHVVEDTPPSAFFAKFTQASGDVPKGPSLHTRNTLIARVGA